MLEPEIPIRADTEKAQVHIVCIQGIVEVDSLSGQILRILDDNRNALLVNAPLTPLAAVEQGELDPCQKGARNGPRTAFHQLASHTQPTSS
jgi:hypothetical protein